tara:strand:+ start:1652 stop:2173 length:522 start_codon:yes stop_codon:yes gene_type:complete
MVALPQVHNVKDLPDSGGNSVLIPAGQYKAVIVKSDLRDTNDKAGKFLALTVVITDGVHKGSEFTERLNIINKNDVAVNIAYKTLARISESFGMDKTPADSNELHNKPLMIEIVNKKSKDWTNKEGQTVEGKEQSEIKKYMAVPASGVPTPSAEPTEAVQASNDAPTSNPFAA